MKINEIKRMQQLAGLITESQLNEELSKEEKIAIFNKIAQTMEEFRNIVKKENIIPIPSGRFEDSRGDYFLSLMLQIKEEAYAFINKINKQTELNENVSNDVEKYLKHHFEVYLEGGDTFEEEPGKTHTFTMERDEFGNPEQYDDADIFKKATEQLKSSSFIFDEEGYGNITFKSDGTNIMVSFIVPDEEY